MSPNSHSCAAIKRRSAVRRASDKAPLPSPPPRLSAEGSLLVIKSSPQRRRFHCAGQMGCLARIHDSIPLLLCMYRRNRSPTHIPRSLDLRVPVPPSQRPFCTLFADPWTSCYLFPRPLYYQSFDGRAGEHSARH